jgi:hypothetical protein
MVADLLTKCFTKKPVSFACLLFGYVLNVDMAVLEVKVKEGAMERTGQSAAAYSRSWCFLLAATKNVVVCPCNGVLSVVCLVAMVPFFESSRSGVRTPTTLMILNSYLTHCLDPNYFFEIPSIKRFVDAGVKYEAKFLVMVLYLSLRPRSDTRRENRGSFGP